MTYWLWTVPADAYSAFVQTGTFALGNRGRERLAEVVAGDRVFAYLTGRRVVAGEFEVVGGPFEDATALVPGRHLPHRVRVRPVAALPEEAWVPREGLDGLRALGAFGELAPSERFRRLVQQGLYPLPPIDGKVLAFMVQVRLGADPEALMSAVDAVRRAREEHAPGPLAGVASGEPGAGDERQPSVGTVETAGAVAEPAVGYVALEWDRAAALERLTAAIARRGFRFEPWEVAAYVTALRTKPLVLLAGVTGVGKSRLPVLVAEATGGAATVVPVRPDWTDPAETMGYTDLGGRFRPGVVLRAARAATPPGDGGAPRFHTLVLDEMNLGRPEHYLAEVLSRIEQREPAPGGWHSPPLLAETLGPADAGWQLVRLPPTLGLVGTVNVDESAHAFSRKVLDRAFVLELAPRALSDWRTVADGDPAPPSETWPARAWTPRATRLGELGALSDDSRPSVERAVATVAETGAILEPAGLGVGYRARDEVALFVLHAAETARAFRTAGGDPVDPLDLALLAKLAPRIDGARAAARAAAYGLLGWAVDGRPADAARATALVDDWQAAGRPPALDGARFPRTAARLARVAEGALDDGVASFWA